MMDFFRSFQIEAIVALAVGFVTSRYYMYQRKAITAGTTAITTSARFDEGTTTTNTPKLKLKLVDPTDAFTKEELSALTEVWEDEHPPGKFLKGRHGITHFIVDRNNHHDDDDDDKNNNQNQNKGMVILSHGLGSSSKMYHDLSSTLVQNGYTVLRYDYFGHGYSKYTGESAPWIKYTPNYFVDQLEDLLDFVLLKDEADEVNEEDEDGQGGGKEKKEEIKVVGFIGHSNGGVNGISANYRWASVRANANAKDEKNIMRNLIPKMILVNPSVYAKKPILGRIADSIPRFMTGFMKVIPSAVGLVGDTYMEAAIIAFARRNNDDKDDDDDDDARAQAQTQTQTTTTTKEYMYKYPDAYTKNLGTNLRLFGRVKGVKRHPFLEPAILGVSSYNIPDSMLPIHRENLSKLLSMSRSDNDDGNGNGKRSDTLFIWCDLDVTVPYKENIDSIRKLEEENDNLTLKIVHGLGHECFLEDSSVIANLVLPFLEE